MLFLHKQQRRNVKRDATQLGTQIRSIIPCRKGRGGEGEGQIFSNFMCVCVFVYTYKE